MSMVELREEGPIAIVTINKPKLLNALCTNVLNELKELFEKIKLNKKIKTVIITGAGEKAFVAGADISQMENMTTEQGYRYSTLGQEIFALIENLPQPVIAAVNGYALGGGFELAMSCDLIIASNKAKFGLPEVTLGIIPGYGGTQRLSRIIGKRKALELILTGEIIDSKKAEQLGILNSVVEHEKLIDYCMELAQKISNKGQIAVRAAKEAVVKGSNSDLNSALAIENSLFGLCFATEDRKEGIKAFLEKRKPNFQDH